MLMTATGHVLEKVQEASYKVVELMAKAIHSRMELLSMLLVTWSQSACRDTSQLALTAPPDL